MSNLESESDSTILKGLNNYGFYSVDLFFHKLLDLSDGWGVRQYLTPIFKRLLNKITDPTIRSWIISFINGGRENFVNIFMDLYHYRGQYGVISDEEQLVLHILHMHKINVIIPEKAFELMNYCMYESSCALLLRTRISQSDDFGLNSLLIEKKIKNNYFIQGACIKIDNLLKNPEIFYQEPFFWPLTLVEKESAIQFSKKLNEFFILVLEEDIKEIFSNPSEGNLLLNSSCELSVNFNLYRFIIEQWWQLQRMNVPYQQAISMLKTYILVHRSFFDYLKYDFLILLENSFTININGLIELMKKEADKTITIDDGRLFVFAISVFPLCLEFIAREPRLHWIITTCLEMNKGLYSSGLYRLCEILNHLFAKKSPNDFLQCFENREQLFVRMVRMGCSLEFILMIMNGNECFNNEFYFDSNTYSRVFELVKTGENGLKSVLETIELLKRKISDLTNVNRGRLIVLAISVSHPCLEFIADNTKLHWITKNYLSINEGPDSFSIPRFCEVLDHIFTSRSRDNFLQCFENRDQLFVRMIRMDCSLEFILMVLDGDEHFNNKFHFNSNTYLCVSTIMESNKYTTKFIKLLFFETCHVDWLHFEDLPLKSLETSFNFANFVFSYNRILEEEMKVEIFDAIIRISLDLKANEDLNIESLFEGIREYWWSEVLYCLGIGGVLLLYKKFIGNNIYFENSKFLDDKSKFFEHRDRKFLEPICGIEESNADVDSILGYQANNSYAKYLLYVLNKLDLSKDYKEIMLKAYIAYYRARVNEAFATLERENITKKLVELYFILKEKFSFFSKVYFKILFMFVISTTPDVLLAIINSEQLCVIVKGLLDRRFCALFANHIDVALVFSVSFFIYNVMFHENSEEIVEILSDKYQYLGHLICDSDYIGIDLLLKLILEEKDTNYERLSDCEYSNIGFLNYFIKRGHTYLEKFLLDKTINWRDIPDYTNSMLFEYVGIVTIVFGDEPKEEIDELRIALFRLLLTLNIPLYEYITNENILVYAVVRIQRMSPNPTYDTILNVIFNNKELNVRTLLEERHLDPKFYYEYKSITEDYKMLEKGYPIVPYERKRSLYSTLDMNHDLVVWTGFRRPGFGTLWPTPEDFYNLENKFPLANFKPANQHNNASFSFKEENKYPLIPYEGDPFENLKSRFDCTRGGALINSM